MTHTLIRIVPAALLGALVAGCAVVPGDPYYYDGYDTQPRYGYGVYEQPGAIYGAPPPVYVAPPVYGPPPATIYFGGRDRYDWRDRDRIERDRRDQHARDAAAQRDRARDQARREQAERQRRAAEDRRNHGQNGSHNAHNPPAARPPAAPGNRGPGPQDWRARQYSNHPEHGPGS